MIVVTGAAGFIASHFCKKLNSHGIKNLILVDDFTKEDKSENWKNIEYEDKIQREHFFQWAEQNVQHIDFIFHLGARTDYFYTDYNIFETLNLDFSQRVWSFATLNRIPLVYASSYLTNDIYHLTPFSKSKYLFDKWTEKQQQTPPFWAGLRFFQVYGKNEEHKAENASNVYKIYKSITEINDCRDAACHVSTEKNIMQDYIYVNDVSKVLYYFLNHVPQSGIYEVGTGFARPLQAIVDAINKATKLNCYPLPVTRYPLPDTCYPLQNEESDIFQADLTLLRKYAYKQAFMSLEQGIKSMFRE